MTPRLAGLPIRLALPGLRSRRTFFVISLAMVGVVIAGAKLESVATNFIAKRNRSNATTLLTAYEDSRGFKIDEMWANITAKPLQGIGFGIASEPLMMEIERDPILDLPVSAAVEKGVMPVAVLEEVGLAGFVAVVLWVFMLMRRSARGGLAPVTVGLTALLMNMGEATLFSPGGMGLLSLILIGWAFASSQARGQTW